MNKIKIISACDSNMSDLSDISFPTVEKYCLSNSFDYEKFDIISSDRPASWSKIHLLINEILSSKYDYLVWIDTDAIIYNQEFNLQNLLYTNKNIYLSKDLNDFNLGILIIKSCNFCLKLLEKMYSMDHYIDHIWWEQAAFIDLYNSNYESIQDNVEVVDQNILNAYDYRYYGYGESHKGHYNKSSFAIHFPSLDKDLRKTLIQNLL